MAQLLSGVTTSCPSVDADAVREIVDTDLTDSQINFWINFGYTVSRVVSGKLGDCGGGDMECMIITLLAAHGVTLYEGSPKSESVGGEWSITYRGTDGEGLKASLYGQNALALDCSGQLAKVGLKKAQFREVGYYDFKGSESSPLDRTDDD